MTALLSVALILGTLIEWLMERFLAPIPQLRGLPLVFISAGLGVLVAWTIKLDLLSIIGIEGVEYPAVMGYIISGIVVGSGSNVIHKFAKNVRQ